VLREVLARFGIDVDSAQILTGISSLGNLAVAALKAARAIGTALFQALQSLTVEMAEFGDETAKTARQLGVGADQLLGWRFAAERSGVDANQLTTGLRRLQRNIVDAGEGVDTAVRAFRDLGVEFRDSEGGFREIEDILPDLADGFANLESDTQRSARAQQIFGRAGAQLLPFLEGGSEGIRELQRRFEELGGNLGADFFENAEAAQDAMADFELASTAARASLATELLPILTTVVTTIYNFIGGVNRLLDRTNFLRNAVRVLGIALGIVAGVIGIVVAPAILSVLTLMAPIILAVGILAIAIDELITLFSGGDSVIGRFLDAMFGAGTAASIAEAVQRAWTSFVAWLRTNGIPAIQRFGRWLVGLWPQVRPVLAAIGSGILFLGRFFVILGGQIVRAARTLIAWITLPGRILAAFVPVRAILGAISSVIRRIGEAATRLGDRLRPVAQAMGQALRSAGEAARPLIDTLERGLRLAGQVGRALSVSPLGIDVIGAFEQASQPVAVAPGARGGDTNVEQRNEISINGTDLSADEIQERVTNAIRDANQRALRVAERALTTVAG